MSECAEFRGRPFARVAVPTVVFPSANVTVPVGVPLAELTTAVNVTDCPNMEGLSEELRVVVVVAIPVPDKLTICGLPPVAIS